MAKRETSLRAVETVSRSERGGAAANRRHRHSGIRRVVEVLDCLYTSGGPLRPNQIAAAMRAPRSTIYDIVGQMLETGLIESFDGDGRVFLGRRMHYFGMAYVKNFSLMREAEQALRQLTQRTNQTSQLCMIEGRKYVVALMRLGGPHFRLSSDIGQQYPLPWTASGPLLVSHMPDVEILKFIPPEDFELPDGKPIEPKAFLQKVRLARQRGLSRNDAVVDAFTHCMAAPVMDAEGKCVATLCLVVARVEAERRGDELAAALVEAAARLSEQIGGGRVAGPRARRSVAER